MDDKKYNIFVSYAWRDNKPFDASPYGFLAVLGTSGSGKSSLVRAGLLAEIHGQTDQLPLLQHALMR